MCNSGVGKANKMTLEHVLVCSHLATAMLAAKGSGTMCWQKARLSGYKHYCWHKYTVVMHDNPQFCSNAHDDNWRNDCCSCMTELLPRDQAHKCWQQVQYSSAAPRQSSARNVMHKRALCTRTVPLAWRKALLAPTSQRSLIAGDRCQWLAPFPASGGCSRDMRCQDRKNTLLPLHQNSCHEGSCWAAPKRDVCTDQWIRQLRIQRCTSQQTITTPQAI